MCPSATPDVRPQDDAQADAAALRTFGTTQPAGAARLLQAGPLSCRLEDGGLRAICWHDEEVVRAIASLLRDEDWGTVPAAIRHRATAQPAAGFALAFDLEWTLPHGRLRAQARIDGHADGVLTFKVEATADASLSTNRCGFVVLHAAGVAGCALRVEHTDGTVEDTCFPQRISPSQVAFGIRRLTHVAPSGLEVDCRLQAELPHDPQGRFEMEDQRNWSDASFKTYVASLLDPWPYTLPAGRTLAQQVTVTVLEVDMDRKRISLSMRTNPDAPNRPAGGERKSGGPRNGQARGGSRGGKGGGKKSQRPQEKPFNNPFVDFFKDWQDGKGK